MKLERLPSGSYRIRQMYKGKSYRITFDHKPTQKEINIALAEKMEQSDQSTDTARAGSFGAALDAYITLRSNVCSPATIRGYKQLRNMFSDEFSNLNVFDITQDDIQKEVNNYAANHSAKSVCNLHGLIVPVMESKRPNFKIRTTLPQKEDREAFIPEHSDIIKLLESVKGTEYYVPIYLGCHGLRRSEIIALTMDDLEGNIITIRKGMVQNANNQYVVKMTKTSSGFRKLAIAQELADAIRDKGYVYKGHPGNILRALHRAQDRLGIERCKLHELRHFYVSYAHDLGMSDENIIYSIGHKTDATMKRLYRHKMKEAEAQQKVAESLNMSMAK